MAQRPLAERKSGCAAFELGTVFVPASKISLAGKIGNGFDVITNPYIFNKPQGIFAQGQEFEKYLGGTGRYGVDLNIAFKKNFKTFDFFDNGIATSAKTLDTLTASRLSNPAQIEKLLNKHIRAASDFTGEFAVKANYRLRPSQISRTQLELAVPYNTTRAQFRFIQNSIDYGRGLDNPVFVNVTRVKGP